MEFIGMPIGPPLITVAIPTLNRPGLLRHTLESVLAQTWTRIEILVSDNASGPDTAEVINSFDDPRIRAFRQSSRLEMVPHWNFCLSKAEGDWFLLLSDDDLLLPTALEDLLQPLINGSATMSYSPSIAIDGEGVEGVHSPIGPPLSTGVACIQGQLARNLIVLPSGLLGRTEHLRALGGFPDIGTTSDLGLRLLMATAGPVACLQTPLLRYRVHGGNLSGQSPLVVESHLALERWSQGRSELAPYLSDISTFVWRGVTGYGVRSAMMEDLPGVEASRGAVPQVRVPLWRKWIAIWAIRAAMLKPLRVLMMARERWLRYFLAKG